MTSADAGPPPGDPTEAAPGGGSTDVPAKPTRMTRSERQAGAVIAGVMVAAVALSSVAGDVFGGKSTTVIETAIGLGFTVLLAAAVWYGQRVIGSLAAMMAGLAPMAPRSGFAVLPFASLGYGGFLMFRASQAQKKAALARPRRPRRAKAGPRSTKDAAASTTTSGANGVRRPSANRRYTPPKSKGGTRRR